MTSIDVRPGRLLDPSLLRDTIHAALRTGCDFAEVFVEDRRSMSALFDAGRVEELTGGRSRGAGIRVVFGETPGFAHTADLSPAGLRLSADAASASRTSSMSFRERRSMWYSGTLILRYS